MKHYFNAFKKYATFHGRATRTEYFYFLVINKLLFTVSQELGKYLGLECGSFDLLGINFTLTYTGLLYIAIVLLPAITVGARRVQDAGKPGLYGFLFPYCIYLVLKDSEKGTNQWGENPHGILK